MQSLHSYIVDKFGYKSLTAEMIEVFSFSVAYIIRQLDTFDFQKNLHGHCKHTGFSAKVYRLHLQRHGAYNLHIKIFVCNAFKGGAPASRKQLFSMAKHHGVARSDAEIIYSMYKECAWFKESCDAFCSKVDYAGKHISITELERQFSEMYPALLKYAKRFAYEKLRFLYEAHNETRDVYTSELLEKAATAYYTMVPVSVSDLHLLNKLKQTIENHGINIIYRETSQKAGRMIEGVVNKDGVRGSAQLVCASFTQMMTKTSEDLEEPSGVDDTFHKFELQFSISQILSRLEKTSRRYRMLMILMGHDDPEFTAWLVQHKHCRAGKDHEDVQQKLPTAEFNSLLCQFLNFSERKAAAFLKKIESSLPQGAAYVVTQQ